MKACIGVSCRKNGSIIAGDVVLGLRARHFEGVGRWRVRLRAPAKRERREESEKGVFRPDCRSVRPDLEMAEPKAP